MKRIFWGVCLSATLAAATVWAQPGRGGMGGAPGMSANMAKFFGDNKAFTAKMVTSMPNPSGSGTMTMEMDMAMLDGKTRVEMDMTKMKGANMPPNAVAQMKQMGMDQTVNIIRPDLKTSYMVYPHLSAYAAMTMTDKQVADAMDDSKLEKISLGKDTIDGHPCEKNKLIFTDPDGQKHEVTVWNATDIKNFPVQMQMDAQGNTMTMKYKDIKLEKPAASLFDPPKDYTKYSSPMALMQAEMSKRGGGGFGTPPPR